MANSTLIVRYSQIGDVIIVIPVIISLAKKYPQDKFTVLTNARFAGIFKQMPPNVRLMPMIYRKKTGAFRGIHYLYERYSRLLKIFFSQKYDKVALLQRGSFEDQLKCLLSFRKSKVAYIDLEGLMSEDRLKMESTYYTKSLNQCYITTLSELGYHGLQNEFDASCYKDNEFLKKIRSLYRISGSEILIGVAPFSRISSKVYPLHKMEEVIRYFSEKPNVRLLIFGGGKEEQEHAEKWEGLYSGVISMIGKLTFDEEIKLIACLSCMLSMDSANLHLSALVGAPVISVWGPSHPGLGYYPYNLDPENAVQRKLYCRPCSFCGTKDCVNPLQYDCMNIDPQVIIQHVENIIQKGSNTDCDAKQ